MQQSKLAMETNQLVVGIVTAAFVFGAYFLWLFQGHGGMFRCMRFATGQRWALLPVACFWPLMPF